jgi:hypothetical protein
MTSAPHGCKLGRLHRTYDPRVPHMSALITGQQLAPPPASVNYSTKLKAPLGMMLNDTLGDCTCAAFYHAIQVWSANTQKKMITEPDSDVEALYIQGCGYNPRVPGEGPGGNEQKLLTYILKTGAPYGPGGLQRHTIAAFIEVDPRNIDDVKRTIHDCGVAYIGFNVPQFLMPANGIPPKVWKTQASDTTIVGGHAVVLVGYDANAAILISWGSLYRMEWDFFSTYVDEVYAIADATWISAKKTTPGGLTLSELEVQMQALRAS